MRIRSSIPALAAVACGLLLLAAPAAAQEEAQDEQEWPTPQPPPKAGMPRALAGPNVLDRLEQMSPQERQRVLDRLPPERRRRLEERLEAYDRLPPEERERLRRQYERFNSLTPEQQRAARFLFRRFAALPPERKQVLRQEAHRLSQMTFAQRQRRMASPEFQDRYPVEERQILRALAAITPNP
jgi:Protein of unknown function (DUF3106)